VTVDSQHCVDAQGLFALGLGGGGYPIPDSGSQIINEVPAKSQTSPCRFEGEENRDTAIAARD
jgi:hypothetical protein